ncbi:MAG: LuxR family transcriptional regulator [Rhodobacteraceae bacterium]|jgi:LuxR family transcriptional regulator|nr:LuxR family transcriptional regulator [Paracoccaceae bacterium]
MKDRALDHLERLLHATTIEETWNLHCAAMACFDFDRLIYGFTRFRSSSGLGEPDDLLVLSNMDSCYVAQFVRGGLYRKAPMVRWATENTGACSWRWMQQNEASLSEAERQVIEFNKRFNVVAGYTISFPQVSTRSHGAIGLAARAGLSQRDVEERWAADGSLVHMLNNAFHLKATSLPYTHVNPLTPRQREVLEWVGDGKTMQDIAAIMGVTSATVEKHLRLAREALGVETTAQAVLKASYKNQIFVIDPITRA